MKLLTRRGVLIDEIGQTYLADPDADGAKARTLRPLQAAAVTHRVALSPRAGQKVLTLRGAMPREDRARQPLCAGMHVAVQVEPHDRKQLELLCRYITRPALSDERVQINTGRAGGAQAQDVLARRDQPPGDEPVEVHPAAGRVGFAARLHLPMTASRRPILAVGCPLGVDFWR
jgi:hypothetical protein